MNANHGRLAGRPPRISRRGSRIAGRDAADLDLLDEAQPTTAITTPAYRSTTATRSWNTHRMRRIGEPARARGDVVILLSYHTNRPTSRPIAASLMHKQAHSEAPPPLRFPFR